jgi:hypothetical protein
VVNVDPPRNRRAPAASPSSSRGVQGLHVVPSPQLNGLILNAAAAVTDNDIRAVGDISTGGRTTQTPAEHFDGMSWSVVPSPNPQGNNSLVVIRAVSANDVWAFGLQLNGPFTEHWDGTS